MSSYRIYDKQRRTHYDFDADTEALAVQAVQNDQWVEQLDPANVTPVEQFTVERRGASG